MWANKKNNTGFTIVETLIVLVVTGVIFISTAALIAGQTGKTRERESIRNVETTMRDVLNDVTTGYYPEIATKYKCVATSKDVLSISVDATSVRGGNPQCVIAGKRIDVNADNITITPLVADATDTTIDVTKLVSVNQLKEVKNYSYGASLVGPARTYYLVNSLLSAGAAAYGAYTSGAQNVLLLNTGGNSLPTAGDTIVLCSNSRQSSIILGENGGLVVRSVLASGGNC